MVPFMMVLLMLVAVFLIMLVLVQRGRGGGLAGALGGMGGQSAFGTKAGDLFTRVTIVVAAIWILTCVALIIRLNQNDRASNPGAGFGANAPKNTTTPTGLPPLGPGADTDAGLEGTNSTLEGEGAADEPTSDGADATKSPSNDSPASDPPADSTPAGDTPAGDSGSESSEK
ncbi:MAG: preprotein translocase subunit SecG [Pirellulales bacterium]